LVVVVAVVVEVVVVVVVAVVVEVVSAAHLIKSFSRWLLHRRAHSLKKS